MDKSSKTLIGAVIGVAAFGIIIPFVGPLFGFGMGPAPAWAVTSGRVIRHVIPGIVVIAGAGMLISRSRLLRRLGAALAIVAGGWFASAPFLLSSEGTLALARRLVYHTGTGFVLVVVAAYAMGRLNARESLAEEPGTASESATRGNTLPATGSQA